MLFDTIMTTIKFANEAEVEVPAHLETQIVGVVASGINELVLIGKNDATFFAITPCCFSDTNARTFYSGHLLGIVCGVCLKTNLDPKLFSKPSSNFPEGLIPLVK